MPCSGCSALHGVNPNQKIICVDEQYSKPYKTTFVKIYVFDKFINDVENESECCHTIIKREFKKPFLWPKKS